MKLYKFAYLSSKPLGNHTLKIMKNTWKFTKKPGKIMEISWNFVSQKKWEPCHGNSYVILIVYLLELFVNYANGLPCDC